MSRLIIGINTEHIHPSKIITILYNEQINKRGFIVDAKKLLVINVEWNKING